MSDNVIRDGDNSGTSAAPSCADTKLQLYIRGIWRRLTLPIGCVYCFMGMFASYQVPLELARFPKDAASARRGLVQLRDIGLLAQQLIFPMFMFYTVVRTLTIRWYSYDIMQNIVLLCIDNAIILLVPTLSFFELKALRRMIAAKLYASNLIHSLFDGEDISTEILRKTPQPFRFMFNTYKLTNRYRCIDALADNLDWYLSPELLHIRWIWVGYIFGIAAFFSIMFSPLIINYSSMEPMRPKYILLIICSVMVLQLYYVSIYRRVVCREYLLLYIHERFCLDAPGVATKPLQ
jgi:hypothetical protein